MTEPRPVVYVVDDDKAVRTALDSLLRSVGLEVRHFGSAKEFLNSLQPESPGCLILDVRMPGISGLEFQRQLSEQDINIPIIFLTAHGDIPMTVRAMKAGAVEFLTKPFRDQDLLDAIYVGLERDRFRREREHEVSALRRRFTDLTPKEREILPLVVSGLPNKQIAIRLATSEAAIKVHRSQFMRKMGADSLATLVRMAEKLGIRPDEKNENHLPQQQERRWEGF
jgi:FixJ family two-component response regulator